MEDNKKLDIDNRETVEYSEEEMKKLQDENLEGVAGGAAEEVAAGVIELRTLGSGTPVGVPWLEGGR